MLINDKVSMDHFRTEFLTFLTRNKLNLMSFIQGNNDCINDITMLKRKINENYGLIHQRLNSCTKIDIEFFQKLVNLIDKDQKIQFIREKVIISKRF